VGGAEYRQVVKHLSTTGADEPFRDRVRPRGPVPQPQDFNAFRAEDLVEAGSELGVPIAEQELGRQRPILELPGQVPGLLGDPLAGGVGGDAAEVDLAASDLDEKQDVEALEPGGLDSEEVTGVQVAHCHRHPDGGGFFGSTTMTALALFM